MLDTEWIVLDLETTGFSKPIYVVELAAQRMRGWSADGGPFRRLVNHGEEIPGEASRVHGYTKEILERDGCRPFEVYKDFAKYVGPRPLVSYNTSYDLDEVLHPEWRRLGIGAIGEFGFCALRLTQRLLDPTPAGNVKLQTLRQFYNLPERGAHTAAGDVATVIDLLQAVLRPIAERRGLTSWAKIKAYAKEEWFPSRLTFGKYKGRDFRDAAHDADLRSWLDWLSRSTNDRSSRMGHWYLGALQTTDLEPDEVLISASSVASDERNEVGAGVVLFSDPELRILRELIEAARARLANVEAEHSGLRAAVDEVQGRLFVRLQPLYQERDALRLRIRYRQVYLRQLLEAGDDACEGVRAEFERENARTEREYNEAGRHAQSRREMSSEEQAELRSVYRKLCGVYHPDLAMQDPERRAAHENLTKVITEAKERGDIGTLREVSQDPKAYMAAQGWTAFDFSDAGQVKALRRLYRALQADILASLEALGTLRSSPEHELWLLVRSRPAVLDEVCESQARELRIEIAKLEKEAAQLREEILELTGGTESAI